MSRDCGDRSFRVVNGRVRLFNLERPANGKEKGAHKRKALYTTGDVSCSHCHVDVVKKSAKE